ncbi:hypothetical protein ECANGB1_856 [Enterospora canceri]|uniref:Uncharacterized protein n=1 Tax=Enterospora canceri TaxID=1081671 RepID=A0A1Y1S7B1_9MICR|nr:hypothetical protein ECANGB1_856 [Enterospora canceri]
MFLGLVVQIGDAIAADLGRVFVLNGNMMVDMHYTVDRKQDGHLVEPNSSAKLMQIDQFYDVFYNNELYHVEMVGSVGFVTPKDMILKNWEVSDQLRSSLTRFVEERTVKCVQEFIGKMKESTETKLERFDPSNEEGMNDTVICVHEARFNVEKEAEANQLNDWVVTLMYTIRKSKEIGTGGNGSPKDELKNALVNWRDTHVDREETAKSASAGTDTETDEIEEEVFEPIENVNIFIGNMKQKEFSEKWQGIIKKIGRGEEEEIDD